jgi:hypothetical protein
MSTRTNNEIIEMAEHFKFGYLLVESAESSVERKVEGQLGASGKTSLTSLNPV